MRELCSRHAAVLIFDEVMTGFRVGPRGAQGLYGVTPDLTTLGKVIGGGMPVGAFGGRREIMARIAPLGPVYQAGTLSGNPVAVAAGLATLQLLQADGFYERADAADPPAHRRPGGGRAAARRAFLCAVDRRHVRRLLSPQCPQTYSEVMSCDKDAFNRFFHAMLDAGHYFAPSAFEAGFVSAAHGEATSPPPSLPPKPFSAPGKEVCQAGDSITRPGGWRLA
jgi:glutamate-1-semialdehyde 2,1-aminomutase